ncbi:MAG: GntR family transcriptional regulator [Firmicutes bacterium]|nr:GntR family transcriptional regulator [Bacillota bacterium]
MWLRIDPRQAKPLYLQVVDGVKEAVAKEALKAGDRLPSVRELAATMTLNPNTVAKAYQELEREGVIEVIRGRGTFVAKPGARPHKEEQLNAMKEMMKQVWVEAQHLGLSTPDFLELIRAWTAEWDGAKGRESRGSSH